MIDYLSRPTPTRLTYWPGNTDKNRGLPEGGIVKPNCERFDYCNASMCPLMEKDYLKKLRGYLVEDDEICSRRGMAMDEMVSKQKKLKRAGATGLFTFKMMDKIERVTACHGLDLEAMHNGQTHRKAAQWIKAYSQERHKTTAPLKKVV